MPHFLMIGSMELILIVAAIVLLFGGKKIPELMRGLGKGVRSFREGMQEMTEMTEENRNGKASDDGGPIAKE